MTMPNYFTGGGGGTLPDIGVPYAYISPTSIPDFQSLLDQVLGAMPGSLPTFQGALQSGLDSPIFQAILGPAMDVYRTQQDVAREALTDRFRAAGNLAGGAHGVAAGRLEEGILRQQGGLISDILKGFIPSLVQGISADVQSGMAIPSLLAEVLGGIRPQVVTGQNASVSGGGGGSLGSTWQTSEQELADAAQRWASMWGGVQQPVKGTLAEPPVGTYNPGTGLSSWYLPDSGDSLVDIAAQGGGAGWWG